MTATIESIEKRLGKHNADNPLRSVVLSTEDWMAARILHDLSSEVFSGSNREALIGEARRLAAIDFARADGDVGDHRNDSVQKLTEFAEKLNEQT